MADYALVNIGKQKEINLKLNILLSLQALHNCENILVNLVYT